MYTSFLSSCAIAQVQASEALPTVSVPTSEIFTYFLIGTVLLLVLVAILRRETGAADEPKAPAAGSASGAAAPVAASAAVDSRLIAVIAAAAYATLGQNVRVVSVQPASAEWGMQGRRDIFSSHKIR